jgi:Demerecviridae HNH endonuclease
MPCATKLRLLLAYDPETGSLTWRMSARRGYKPGDIAGTIHHARNTYRIVRLEGRGYYAARLIWKIVTGCEPQGVVDHKDGDGLNDRWFNLREASECQNSHNRRLNKNNSSGVKGVHPEGDRWRAVIKKDRRTFDLGRFDRVEDAKLEIEAMRQKLHAEFARFV